MKQPDEFKIPAAPWQEVEKSVEALATQVAASGADAGPYPDTPKIIKAFAGIATAIWKARSRTVDPASGDVREGMKRVHGDIERIERFLTELGVVVEDHTGKPFDYGLPWKVGATKPMPGLGKEIVTETFQPTIKWNGQIIQNAEVEIGTPV